jgi:translocation and assembly module TamB
MTNDFNPEKENNNNEPPSENQPLETTIETSETEPIIKKKPLWLIILTRSSIGLGIIFILSLLGGGWWLSRFVNKDLSPLVEKNLTNLLDRPVKLGKVEKFSTNGLTFAASSIPATNTDPDTVTIDNVEVNFDPISLLTNRTLNLDVKLIKPSVYIQQDEEGRWINTKLKQQPSQGLITTKIKTIEIANAEVKLLADPRKEPVNITTPTPREPQKLPSDEPTKKQVGKPDQTANDEPRKKQIEKTDETANKDTNLPKVIPPINPTKTVIPPAVIFTDVNVKAQLLERNQLIRFELNANPETQGNLKIWGDYRPQKQTAILTINTEKLPANNVSNLIKLPLDLQTGIVTGNLDLKLVGNDPALINGTVNVEGVNAKVSNLPQTLNKIVGKLQFKDYVIDIPKLQTEYGQIPLEVAGNIDRQSGFNLKAKMLPVGLKNIIQTFDLKLPVYFPVLDAQGNIENIDFPVPNVSFLNPEIPTLPPIFPEKTEPKNQRKTDIKKSLKIETKTQPQVQTSSFKVPLSGEVIGDLTLTGALNKPLLSGNVKSNKLILIDKINWKNFSGKFEVLGGNLTVKDIKALSTVGAEIQGSAQAKLGANGGLLLNLTSNNIPGDAIAKIYGFNLPLTIGTVAGTGQVAGTWGNLQTIVRWNAPKSTYPSSGELVIFPDGKTIIRNSNFQAFGGKIGGDLSIVNNFLQSQGNFQFPLNLLLQNNNKNPFNGEFKLNSQLNNFQSENLQASALVNMDLAGGKVRAKNIDFKNGIWTANIDADGVNLAQLFPVPPLLKGRFFGTLELSGPMNAPQLQNINGLIKGSLMVGGGKLNTANLTVKNGNWRGTIKAMDVQLQKIAFIPPQFQGLLSANLDLIGSLNNFKAESISGTGTADLKLASGGKLTVTDVQLGGGKWEAKLQASGLGLGNFSQELRGSLDGLLLLTGTINNINLAGIKGSGNVRLNQGISVINRPINAAVIWDGQKLVIQKAQAENLQAKGTIIPNLKKLGINDINLQVQTNNLSLANLPLKLPSNITATGQLNFHGTLSGKPDYLTIVGTIPEMRNLQVKQIAFEPILRGSVNIQPGKTTNLELSGNQDKIALSLKGNNQPESFFFKHQNIIAQGETQGENLLVETQNFPLDMIKDFANNKALGKTDIHGNLNGKFTINLANSSIIGEQVAIAQPMINNLDSLVEKIQGDLFTVNFTYLNGLATINQGELLQGTAKYIVNGMFKNPLDFNATIDFVDAKIDKIENILPQLRKLELEDIINGFKKPEYNQSVDLIGISSVGITNKKSLESQLERITEITALLQQQKQQRKQKSPLPQLRDLTGGFNGRISVNNSKQNGLKAEFNLLGNNWQWGEYKANQITAKGGWENGYFTFQPLEIKSDQTLISFSGNLGEKDAGGQLTLDNIPAVFFKEKLNLPIDITGNIKSNATINLNKNNPQSTGQIELEKATLNGAEFASIFGSFTYNNSRLTLSGIKLNNATTTSSIVTPESFKINVSFPYKLFPSQVNPNNDNFNVTFNLKNESFSLLNLLTKNQVIWQSGIGNLNLEVKGLFNSMTQEITDLSTEGQAVIHHTVIKAQALPNLLTDVEGVINFDFDTINVQELSAKFSGGELTAKGIIPIITPLEDENQSLDIKIDRKLALNLPNIYNGSVSGNLQVTGTLIAPIIGGELQLFDGYVFLNDKEKRQQIANNSDKNNQNNIETSKSNTEFNNLGLELKDNVQVTQAPIMNFLAQGKLRVNGNFDNIKHQGEIELKKGLVNLFTTQFRLARGYKHTAIFYPEQGLTPDLDIRLQAGVSEIVRNRLDINPALNEINDKSATNLGALQTVKIDAKVRGLTNQLTTETLELSSSPPRTKAEIINLLGGGFVQNIVDKDADTKLGLANLASTAILGNIQTIMGDALGLTEFRLFPTVVTNNSKKEQGSILGLGAEIGLDITPKFSTSILKFLTVDQPPLYNLRYRVNDDVLLRGATDLSGDSRFVVEYQNRF